MQGLGILSKKKVQQTQQVQQVQQPVVEKKVSVLEPYIDKRYNIVAKADKGSNIQPISQFKVVEKGDVVVVDTPNGKGKAKVQYGEVLLENQYGNKSLVSVGEVADKYFVDKEARDALLAVAVEGLKNNQVEVVYPSAADPYIRNDRYVCNGKSYFPNDIIKKKVSGLVDPSKHFPSGYGDWDYLN